MSLAASDLFGGLTLLAGGMTRKLNAGDGVLKTREWDSAPAKANPTLDTFGVSPTTRRNATDGMAHGVRRTDKAQAPPTRNQSTHTYMPHSPKPKTNEVQTAEAVATAAICSPPLWPEELEKLRDLKVGHECEVHVLPRKGDQARLIPVTVRDGRGEWKRGHLSGINVCVAFEDGTHCWIHPAHINSEYGGKCRLLADGTGANK